MLNFLYILYILLQFLILYFIQITVLIRWIGTQHQIRIEVIRIEVGSKTFHARGHMRGQICLRYAKILKLVSFIQLTFAATRPIIFLK